MNRDLKTFTKEITQLRQKIDDIDAKILCLLAKRQAQVKKVVELKKKTWSPCLSPCKGRRPHFHAEDTGRKSRA
jgi:chorismate mutase